MKLHNGGIPGTGSSIGDGAQDYIEITGILGIGREKKIIVRKLGQSLYDRMAGTLRLAW